jgi:chromosome segregation ATPase
VVTAAAVVARNPRDPRQSSHRDRGSRGDDIDYRDGYITQLIAERTRWRDRAIDAEANQRQQIGALTTANDTLAADLEWFKADAKTARDELAAASVRLKDVNERLRDAESAYAKRSDRYKKDIAGFKKDIAHKDRRIDELKAQLNDERIRGEVTKKSLKRELVSSSTLL